MDDTVLAARQIGLIDAFYRGVTDTAAFEQAMRLFGDAFNCQSTALVALDVAAPRTNMHITTGVFSEAVRSRYAHEYATIDPAPAAFSRLPVGKASTSDRILAPEVISRDVFFNEFFLPLGLTETIGVMLGAGGGRFEMFGLQRGDDRPAFTDSELLFAEAIVPHAARALQLRRLLLAQNLLVSSLEATLDRSPAGILVIDPVSQFAFANEALRAMARRGDGIGLDRNGRLTLTESSARKRFDMLFSAVTRGGAGGTLAVHSPARTRPYVVLVTPLPGGIADALAPAPLRGAMIVVHDPAAELSSPVDMLREALNLPRGAAELALALANGHDLRSYAELQGVTIHTARFHLHTALSRTGAKSQAELMKLVTRLLSDLAARASAH